MTDKNEDESMIARALDNQTIEWLTTSQAAAIMGVTTQAVQNLCKRGALECRKFGNWWQVRKDSAESYVKTVGGRGKKLPTNFE